MGKRGPKKGYMPAVNLKRKLAQINNAAHTDGWGNALVGLERSMDKRSRTTFDNFAVLTEDELGRMYVGDGLGRRVVDVVADDMVREWIDIEDDEKEVIPEMLENIGAEEAFSDALKWQRLYGGALIVVGAMDGQPLDAPLVSEKAKSIEWLKVVNMYDIDLTSSVWDSNPMSKTFGKILTYMIDFRTGTTGTVVRTPVHYTRCLAFFGESVPENIAYTEQKLRYWGSSVLQPIWEQLRDMGGVMGSVANLMYELIIGKYKFANLSQIMAAGKEAQLITRMEIINASKSIINGVLLDSTDEYTRDTANLSGISDVIDRFMMLLSGVTGIPLTRLFGRSPGGLNSTGEGDLSNYYDMVKAKQKTDLKRPLKELLGLLSVIAGYAEPVSFKFNPLVQMTEKEEYEMEKLEADTKRAQAETDKIYIDTGVLSPEEVSIARGFENIEDGSFE